MKTSLQVRSTEWSGKLITFWFLTKFWFLVSRFLVFGFSLSAFWFLTFCFLVSHFLLFLWNQCVLWIKFKIIILLWVSFKGHTGRKESEKPESEKPESEKPESEKPESEKPETRNMHFSNFKSSAICDCYDQTPLSRPQPKVLDQPVPPIFLGHFCPTCQLLSL